MELKSCLSAEITSSLKISDKLAFNYYLKELWQDLLNRRITNQNDKEINSKNQNIKGITKLIFNNYYSLPGIIGERLFHVFVSSRRSIIEFGSFKTYMNNLFCDDYQNSLRFIFDFYDFDGNGKISKEDIRTVLSYVQFSNRKNNKNENKTFDTKQLYENSVKDQYQLNEILEKCFENMGEEITFDDFVIIIETINSEIFFIIYIFLLQNRPFSEKTVTLYQKIINENYTGMSTINLDLQKNTINSDVQYKGSITEYNVSIPNNDFFHFKGISSSVISNPKVHFNSNYNNLKNKKKINFNGVFLDRGDITKTLYEIRLSKEIIDLMNKMELTEEKYLEENNNILESEKNNYEGYLYKISDNGLKVTQIWFKLLFKDLFYYKKKEDQKHYGMHNISGLFFLECKDSEIKFIGNKKYYPFEIIFPLRKHKYYCDNEIDLQNWTKHLKIATEYSNLEKIYEIKDILGSGSFSMVKLGINKITKEKVGVKIMNKDKMNTTRLESARTEIEIMKICQHPNIIHFIDSYETENKIYIFMEYCEGGTFYNFLKARNFILKEELAVNIAHKLCMAVYYFHSFGIIHRDLKPENILMTKKEDDADLKILDFGLGKIVGPNEKSTEPYGTVIYCAPEIILDKPYTKNVDAWSIGIITYIMLYGNLPFFNKDRSRLTKSITRDTPLFRGPNKVSEEGKNFVQRLLIKDQYKRMNIKEALEHKWFRKYNKDFVNDRIKNKDKKNIFELYTSVNINASNSADNKK